MKKIIIIGLVVLLLGFGLLYYFVLSDARKQPITIKVYALNDGTKYKTYCYIDKLGRCIHYNIGEDFYGFDNKMTYNGYDVDDLSDKKIISTYRCKEKKCRLVGSVLDDGYYVFDNDLVFVDLKNNTSKELKLNNIFDFDYMYKFIDISPLIDLESKKLDYTHFMIKYYTDDKAYIENVYNVNNKKLLFEDKYYDIFKKGNNLYSVTDSNRKLFIIDENGNVVNRT